MSSRHFAKPSALHIGLDNLSVCQSILARDYGLKDSERIFEWARVLKSHGADAAKRKSQVLAADVHAALDNQDAARATGPNRITAGHCTKSVQPHDGKDQALQDLHDLQASGFSVILPDGLVQQRSLLPVAAFPAAPVKQDTTQIAGLTTMVAGACPRTAQELQDEAQAMKDLLELQASGISVVPPHGSGHRGQIQSGP